MAHGSPRSRRAFLLGAGTNWLAFAAVLAVSFFLTPYLIAALGKPRYDVWCVAESVLAYFTLLDMGVAACLTRSVARRHAAADRDGLNRVASACLAVFLAAGGAALLVGVPVLVGLAPQLNAKAGDDVLPFLLLMLANLAATLPLSVFPAVLDGLERFAAKSLARVAALALRTVGIVAVVGDGGGLLHVAAVFTAANLVEHAAFAGLCWRFAPGLRFSHRLVDRATLREVRGYSTDAFLAMLAGRVTVQTGAIVVGVFLPAGDVTFFATAARLVEYAKTLLRTVTATLTPGVSAMEARGDHAGVRRVFLAATRWVLYLVVPVNLGLWFFGRPFLERWVGPDFIPGSYPAMAVLAATLTVGVAQSVASRILYGLGRLRLFARLALVEAGLNLGLTLVLVGPLGVEGVAIAVALPNVLFCLVVIGFTARELGATAGEYLAAWVKPLAAWVVPAAVWLAAGPAEPTWWAVGVGILAGLVPYAAVAGAAEFGRPLLARVRLPVIGNPGRVAQGMRRVNVTRVTTGRPIVAAAEPEHTMKTHILAAALAVGGVAAGAGDASAQGRFYPTYPNATPFNQGYYRQAAPVGWPSPVAPQYVPSPFAPSPGFSGPAFGGGPDVAFVRSLYNQYLHREPDPQGLVTWVNRLAQSGGDTNLVTQEFLYNAQAELIVNSPRVPFQGYR